MINFDSPEPLQRDRIIAKLILAMLDAGIDVISPYDVENFAQAVLEPHTHTKRFFYNDAGDQRDVRKYATQLLCATQLLARIPVISLGDMVVVTPNKNDTFTNEFTGRVDRLEDEYVIVKDQDNDAYQVRPTQCRVIED